MNATTSGFGNMDAEAASQGYGIVGLAVLASSALLGDREDKKEEEDVAKKLEMPDSVRMLPGEELLGSIGTSTDGVFFTSYRAVFISSADGLSISVVPTATIESSELRRETVTVTCKNGRTFSFSASSTYSAAAIRQRLEAIAKEPRYTESIFAFQVAHRLQKPTWLRSSEGSIYGLDLPELQEEIERLGFGDSWRISTANEDFGISASYPQHFLVPKQISDNFLFSAAPGRFLGRVPAAVWRHPRSGAILLRSSQPVISLLGNSYDEDVALLDACRRTAGGSSQSPQGSSTFLVSEDAEMAIIDCRSYTSACANRLKSGGYESSSVYKKCEVRFMNLPNIHLVRSSFAQFRTALFEEDEYTKM
uniref:Myotubularin phosphatase domain-containing protein n=1 Tax=Steinernema glaseri TaxID=37863 RepID=A0A1I8AAK2_9BILA